MIFSVGRVLRNNTNADLNVFIVRWSLTVYKHNACYINFHAAFLRQNNVYLQIFLASINTIIAAGS